MVIEIGFSNGKYSSSARRSPVDGFEEAHSAGKTQKAKRNKEPAQGRPVTKAPFGSWMRRDVRNQAETFTKRSEIHFVITARGRSAGSHCWLTHCALPWQRLW